MLRKEVILREIRRFNWIAQQTDDPSEQAFYLGAAIALSQTIGYESGGASRIELEYERDVKKSGVPAPETWNIALCGDPFPISEEIWLLQHPGSKINRLVNDPNGIDPLLNKPRRHDRIYK